MTASDSHATASALLRHSPSLASLVAALIDALNEAAADLRHIMPNISLLKAKTFCIGAVVAVVGVVAVVTGVIGSGALLYGAGSSASYSEMALCVANCLGNRALQPVLFKIIRAAVFVALGGATICYGVQHMRTNVAENETKDLQAEKVIMDIQIESLKDEGTMKAEIFEKLERDNDAYIESLEAENRLMAARIAALEDDDCAKDDRIVALKTENETMASQIAVLKEDNGEKDIRIASLENQVGALQAEVTGLSSWMVSVSQQLNIPPPDHAA
ncbi:hypothetical protein BGZ96_010188 [Linnemannia gamsii]|uniref:Uncharacterized protein n=1 Tax=Linnemannia gamsii TaxID=64522 RepID=A0ABQ7JVQ4_9FUNG|nr:hypothetical protein BGZ96_010188 [Linnemannia gamsii]